MSLNLPFGIKNLSPHSDTSDWYGKYNSLEEAIASVPAGVRDLGLKVGVVTSNGIVEYWWKENTTDAGLVLKDVASIATPQNTIISIGEVVQIDNEYTFQSNGVTNYSWIINSILYSNTTTIITVDYATTGNKRRDMFYLDATNIIKHREGTEVLISEQAITSELLPGEIFLSFIDVTDSTSGTTTPVSTEDFMFRAMLSPLDIVIPTNGLIDISNYQGGQTNFKIFNSENIIKGFIHTLTDSEGDSIEERAKFYPGKIIIIDNQTENNLTIAHLDNTASVKFIFNDENNFIIPSKNKIICIATNEDTIELYTKSWESSVGVTNLSKTLSPTGIDLESSTGTGTNLPLADGTNAGLLSPAEKTKLTGIANNANNYTHPNHSGDVTSLGDGVQTIANEAVTNAKFRNSTAHTVVGRAGSGNGSVADITLGNDTILGRQGSGNVEGLSVSQVKTVLSIDNVDNTSDVNKPVSTAQQTALNLKQNNVIYTTTNVTAVFNNDRFIANGTLTISDISNPIAGSNFEVVVRGGSVTVGGVVYTNGTTVLRVHNGTDWQTFLYQDNFLEFANTNAFPETGKKDVIYLALDTKFQYIWNTGLGQYTQITSGTTSVGIDIALVERPIAMGASLAAGTELGIGNYVYFAVYGTPLGETSAGVTTTIVTTAGNQRVELTVPISTDPTVTYRKIYRTKVNGTGDNQFFTALIADNTTTSFTDSIADASQTGLGLQAYKVNTTSRFFSIGGVQALIADPNLTTLGVGAGEQILLNNGASVRTVLIGQNAGRKITDGGFNVLVGNSGVEMTTASQNTAVGNSTLMTSISGNRCVAFGYQAARFFLGSNITALGTEALRGSTTGDNLVGVGSKAGQFRNDGVELTSLGNGSHYFGAETRASANGVANEQVIGFDARGKGANTVQLGNGNIVDTYLEGRVRLRQYTTATRPAHVVGTVIFDVTLNKMVIGGASGWEVVTSV